RGDGREDQHEQVIEKMPDVQHQEMGTVPGHARLPSGDVPVIAARAPARHPLRHPCGLSCSLGRDRLGLPATAHAGNGGQRMAYEKLDLLIDGEFRQGSTGVTEDVLNPATEEVLGAVPHASKEDLDAALQSSAEGFRVWKAKTPLERQKVMAKAADLLEADADRIARNLTQEMGKPVGEAKMELGFAIDVLRWYGEEGTRAYGRLIPARIPGARQMVVKEPVGPALAFVAWNFPAVNVMRKVAGALGAGCSLIIKPSEETPGTAVAIARALQDAGLPDGVLNVVFGVPDTVSRHILASPVCKKLSFTGSIPVGKHLQKLAADTMKRCTMELGGHAPVIVFDDADVDRAIKTMAGFKFRNAGQVCISPTRFYVQEKVYS